MSQTVTFPPLLSGQEVTGQTDPFDHACGLAARGCDAGLVTYRIDGNSLRAALVLAPDVPLKKAVVMMPVCGIGFQNALGALAPPEVAVHLEWSGPIRINGARCGGLRMAASVDAPDAQPDWLVVGLTVPLWPETDDPGTTPDETTLYAEGCADVDPVRLLESWARHTLVWINRWDEGEIAAIHAEWRGLAHDMGETVSVQAQTGTFVGIDEGFGMLLRVGETTELIPLTQALETP